MGILRILALLTEMYVSDDPDDRRVSVNCTILLVIILMMLALVTFGGPFLIRCLL
jgi:hypothetical protein